MCGINERKRGFTMNSTNQESELMELNYHEAINYLIFLKALKESEAVQVQSPLLPVKAL